MAIFTKSKIDREKNFLKECVTNSWQSNTEAFQDIIKESEGNPDEMIKMLLESDDKAVIRSQAYAVASRMNLDGRHWYRVRGILGDKCCKTISDAGGLKIGSKDKTFSILIPNGYGDGITRYGVLDEKDVTMDIGTAMQYFTIIEGAFSIYDYDCGNTIEEYAEGRYQIYYYDGIIIFVKIAS